MHVNCAGFVYKAMGELIQVLYLYAMPAASYVIQYPVILTIDQTFGPHSMQPY